MAYEEDALEAFVEEEAFKETLESPLPKKGLKDLVLKAFSWSFVGFSLTYLLRFASNLILTRLFLPEAFGIMQLVTVFLQGIAMFSDFGLQINIVQHKQGGDAAFLRTAWTVQILRGFLIQAILLCLSIPLASFYQIPTLKWLIPLAGVNAIIDGLVSTNLVILTRNMEIRKLTILETVSQLIGTALMLLTAWYVREVWTLLVSGLVAGSIKLVYSHLFLSGPKMKWEIDKEYLHEILHFGKWIFISSISGFLLSRLDRVILGLYISIENLGLYGIAFGLGMLMFDLMLSIASRVLVPLYAQLWRDKSSRLRNVTLKVRTLLLIFSFGVLFPIIIWSDQIIQFLYPPAYWGAGWMLKILGIACALKCIYATSSPILIAVGDSWRSMILLIFSALIFIISFALGGYYYGINGLMWAIPLSEIINYPVLVWAVSRYGVWLPLLDFVGFLAISIVVFLG